MFWDELPLELRVYILSMRNIMREDSQKTIAIYWKKFKAPKKIAQLLVNEIRDYGINVMIAETANIMEYCAKVLSGRENPLYWKGILDEVEYELWLYNYNDEPKMEYIYRLEDAFIDLITKFKYGPPGLRHHGRFNGTCVRSFWYN